MEYVTNVLYTTAVGRIQKPQPTLICAYHHLATKDGFL